MIKARLGFFLLSISFSKLRMKSHIVLNEKSHSFDFTVLKQLFPYQKSLFELVFLIIYSENLLLRDDYF